MWLNITNAKEQRSTYQDNNFAEAFKAQIDAASRVIPAMTATTFLLQCDQLFAFHVTPLKVKYTDMTELVDKYMTYSDYICIMLTNYIKDTEVWETSTPFAIISKVETNVEHGTEQ